MKKNSFALLFIFFSFTYISSQVIYDTIPKNDDEGEIGRLWFEDYFIFKDFNQQASTFFKDINFNYLNSNGKIVYVSTVFGKNGEIKDTKIIKSVNPACDSIAFTFVNNLKDWLPGLNRNQFVDIPFVFPFNFDSITFQKSYLRTSSFFIAKENEYKKRKEYFDFIYSSDSVKLINDFNFFQIFLTKELSNDNLYIYRREYSRPNKKNRVKIKLNGDDANNLNFLIYHPDTPKIIKFINSKGKSIIFWDKNEWALKLNATPAKKNDIIYLDKNKNTILICFLKGEKEPILDIYYNTVFTNDTTLNINLKNYTKDILIKELKKDL